ncbi:Cytidylate kinase [Serratia symbiotica]|nr:Cytidylate kinase [Serratia symbiotica]
MKNITPIITIDGPSNSGKSILSKKLGKLLNWNLLDSGSIYRTLAFIMLNNQIDLYSINEIIKIATNLKISFINEDNKLKIFFKNQDITNKIYTEEISNISSKIATLPTVREILLFKQRKFYKKPGLIANGRDMGTIVFPNAPIKIFLNASIEERAKRRKVHLQKKGYNVNIKYILTEIKKRDNLDYNRIISPLIPASNAFFLNSTNLTINMMTKKALLYIQKILKLPK